MVLPVCRSPTISSRWPRPMGMSASMTLIPVCNGTVTGASVHDVRGRAFDRYAPAGNHRQPLRVQSAGRPNGLMMRPINSSPTGTSITCPLRFDFIARSRNCQ